MTDREWQARFEREHDALVRVERQREGERLWARSVTHDLRIPLAVICSGAELLSSDRRVREDEALRRLVEQMNHNARHAARLVADLHELQRIEHDLEIAPADVHALARRCVESHQRVTDAPVTFGFDATPRRMDHPIDAHAFIRILENLLANAVRFARKHVEVALEMEEAHLHVWVGDDGPGLADDALEHVFESYSRYHPGTLSGSGLGLSIVRRLAEMHGGWVGAGRSDLGGARFDVWFPGR